MNRSIYRSSFGILTTIALGLAGSSALQAMVCVSGPPVCTAKPGSSVCSNDSSRQCNTTPDCVGPGTCGAGVLAVGGSATANPNNINSVALTGATNVTLTTSTTPGSVVTFRAFPTNPALDAQATVVATDSSLATCTVHVTFRIRAAGAASNEELCPPSELYSFDVLSSPVSPAGTSACSSHLATCFDMVPPAGYTYLSDSRVLSIRSPIAGAGVQMEMERVGTFDGALRLLFSRSIDLGATFSAYTDVTTTTLPGSTRIRGTATWSDVRVAAAKIDATAIPTVGEWGLVLMSLLVLIASSVFLTRRRFALAGSGNVGYAEPPLFVPRIFVPVLVGTTALGVGILAVVALVLAAPTPTDVVGSLLSAGLLAYLVHLWVVLAEDPSRD